MTLSLSNIPKDLSAGPVSLVFEKIMTPKPGGELVPFYHFKIRTQKNNPLNDQDKTPNNKQKNKIVGHINFRVGETMHIQLVAGHVGYEILPKSRGNYYAYFACLALKPFIRSHYQKVLLTVDPINLASIKIIEKLEAMFIDEMIVPTDDPAYLNGARLKRRYSWVI